jgi:hypothetical protein
MLAAMTAFLDAAPALDPSSAAAEQIWAAIAAPMRAALVVGGIAAAAAHAPGLARRPPRRAPRRQGPDRPAASGGVTAPARRAVATVTAALARSRAWTATAPHRIPTA